MALYETDERLFDWNDDKYKANLAKHGIDFRDAATVFKDDNTVYLYDERHYYGEERFIAIGMSEQFDVLTVCHCYRDDDSVVWLISARKATKKESNLYWR